MPVVTKLCFYPVKSLHGITVDEAELTVRGLKYDRNWMITDETGRFLTQRNMPKLAAIRVRFSGEKLVLEDPSGKSLGIPLNGIGQKESTVDVWGDTCKAFDEGNEASAWLTSALGKFKGKNLRLVRFKTNFKRIVDPVYLKGEKSHTAFADAFPYLVTSENSLNRLNEQLIESGNEPVPMDRFRPNIVIKDCEAFLENKLDELSHIDGNYTLGIRKPCKRCKVTTVNQQSGEIKEPKEPLRTLTLMNTVPGLQGAYFGQNATLLSPDGESINVGDSLEVKMKSSS